MKKIILTGMAVLLFWENVCAIGAGEGVYLGDGGANIQIPGTPTSLSELLLMVMNFLGVSIVFVSVLGFMVGGGFLIFSAGSESIAERGKSILLASVVGISVTLLAYLIVKLVQTFAYSV